MVIKNLRKDLRIYFGSLISGFQELRTRSADTQTATIPSAPGPWDGRAKRTKRSSW